MNKFELSKAFHIGHKKIDSDHATLVSILNDMVDGFNLGDIEYCQKMWQLFFENLKQHFSDEEKIMSDLGFIEINHAINHQINLDHIKKNGEECHSLADWRVCLYTMRDHLITWILKHDLKFAEYLTSIEYKGELLSENNKY